METYGDRARNRTFFGRRRSTLQFHALLLASSVAACSFKLPRSQPAPLSSGAASTHSSSASAPPSAVTTGTDSNDAAVSGEGGAPSQTASSAPSSSGSNPDSGVPTCDPAAPTVPGSCACGEACNYLNGRGTCVDGVCQLLTCEPGFANCDGDTSNGCEVGLDSAAPPLDGIVVPRLDFNGLAVTDVDWSGVPGYGFNYSCQACALKPPYNVKAMVPQTNAGVIPNRLDLSASVKLVWNPEGFWVRMFVADDDWFLLADHPTPVQDTELPPEDARYYDNVELYWDYPDMGFLNNPDHALFFTADDSRSEFLLEQQNTGAMNVIHQEGGGACRVFYAHLTPQFLRDGSGMSLVLAAEQAYGFNLAVNDYDRGVGETGAIEPQRQSQVFLNKMSSGNPDEVYYSDPGLQIGKITLTDPNVPLVANDGGS